MTKEEKPMSLEEILATPVPSKLNGKAALIYPITFKQTAELDKWLRAEFLTETIDAIDASRVSPQRKKELIETAIEISHGITFFVLKDDTRLKDPIFAEEYILRLAHAHYYKDLQTDFSDFRKIFYENFQENIEEFFKALKGFSHSFASWEPEVAAETLIKQKDETTKRAFDFLMTKGWTLEDLQELTLAQVIYAAEAASGTQHTEDITKERFNGSPQELKAWLEQKKKERENK